LSSGYYPDLQSFPTRRSSDLPSNLPLHAFQVMLPFGTMSPVKSVKLARAVYDRVPVLSQIFEDKYGQKLIALIADNGYNLTTNLDRKSTRLNSSHVKISYAVF